jgi:hypothetical protein
MTDEQVDKLWKEFWKPIVCKEDGTVNVDQLKKELADFYFIMTEAPKVYYHVTGGKLSKPMYPADTVCAEADEYYEEHWREVFADTWQEEDDDIS